MRIILLIEQVQALFLFKQYHFQDDIFYMVTLGGHKSNQGYKYLLFVNYIEFLNNLKDLL